MITLNGNSETLRLVRAHAYTTNEVRCSVHFKDRTNTTLEWKTKRSALNGITAVDIIERETDIQKLIHYISLRNIDSVADTFTISTYDHDNSVEDIHWKGLLSPNYTVMYDEGKFIVYNDSGIPVKDIANNYWYNNRFVLSGALYETFDRNLCDEVNTSVLSSGRLSLQAIWLPAGITVSSISLWSATTALGTGTNQLFGLYDNNLNLLRSSVNDTSTAWNANSKKTLALTTTFTTTYSGLYYIGVMVAASTVPTLKGNTGKTGGQLNAGAPSMGGTSNTGLTTALPGTANAPGTVTTSFWACVN